MAAQFNQGAPTVPVVLNTSNCFVFGNTASGNALSVQQFGTGNVASFRTTAGATAMFVNAAGNIGIGTTSPGYLMELAGISSTGNLTALKSPHFFSNTYTTGAVINGASTTVSPNALGNFGGQFLYWVNTTTTGQYYSMGVAYTWNPDLQSVNQLLTSGVTTSLSASKLQITNTSGGTLTFYVRILNLASSVT